jgi:hypothetical protein
MRTRWFGILILLFTLEASAQQLRKPAPPASGPPRQPADSMLSSSLVAHGGIELLGVRAVTITGTSTRGSAVEPLTIHGSFDGHTRIEYGSGEAGSTVSTPGGVFDVRAGKVVSRPPHVGLYSQYDVFSILGLRTTWVNGADRGFMGNGTVGGRQTVKVHAGTNNQKSFYGRQIQDELDVDFDQATGLVAAIHRRGYADDSLDVSFVVSYAFSDYRQHQGLWLPYRIDRYMNGNIKESIRVDSYVINPVLSPSLFQR